MRKTLFALAVSALLVAAPSSAFAKVDSLPSSLGDHWYGPDRTIDGLKGHVVLWENWGYN